MSDPNVLGDDWEQDRGDARGTRVGAAAGGRALGATVYELDPGAHVSPYHLHHANEELLVVLAGEPELRTPEGKRTLTAGAVVSFRPGPDGAHRVSNAGDAPCRVLLISTTIVPEIAEHLDTGTVLAMTAPADGWAFPAGADGDLATLMQRAMEAED